MKIVLNNGVAPSGAFCNADDLQRMMDILDAAEISGAGQTYYNRRLRGSSNSSILSNSNEQETRNLQKYPAQCRQNCVGYATGTCVARLCIGYRRNERDRALTQSLANDNSRELSQQLECAEGLSQFNSEIDALVPQLSSSCRPIVQSSRSVSCFDDVRYAQVESFTLWNADTDTIVKENVKNGDSFCYSDSKLTLEVVTNACVERVIFWLGGPAEGYNEAWQSDGLPYTLFQSNSLTDYNGEKFPVGCYSMGTHIPTSTVTQPTLKFRVEKCPPNGVPTGIADVRQAKIQSFTLWNADTKTIIKENVRNNDSFCYSGSKLSIEAFPNSCVEKVVFWLTGPGGVGGYDEMYGYEGPYTFYMGERLPFGSYKVSTHVPDSSLSQPEITFRIKKC